MEKVVGTRISRQVQKYLPIVPLLILLIIILGDLTVPYYHTPPGADCSDYVIYDVYGLLKNTSISQSPCYISKMSVSDFRSLGKVKARKIIIVTHYFSSGKEVGLGTSDKPSVMTPLLHPISIFYLVKGTTPDNEEYLAVAPGIVSVSRSLDGKVIIIISCSKNVDKLASALIGNGADMVVTSNTPTLSPQKAVSLVKEAVNKNPENLCGMLFTCYGR